MTFDGASPKWFAATKVCNPISACMSKFPFYDVAVKTYVAVRNADRKAQKLLREGASLDNPSQELVGAAVEIAKAAYADPKAGPILAWLDPDPESMAGCWLGSLDQLSPNCCIQAEESSLLLPTWFYLDLKSLRALHQQCLESGKHTITQWEFLAMRHQMMDELSKGLRVRGIRLFPPSEGKAHYEVGKSGCFSLLLCAGAVAYCAWAAVS
jgi:hypothetical protein